MSFNVGDEIRIATDSEHYTDGKDSNPPDVVGEVIEVRSDRGFDGYCYRVKWPNRLSNSYREIDLVSDVYTSLGRETIKGFRFI